MATASTHPAPPSVPPKSSTKRVLSLLRTTGRQHLGNYLGAMKQMGELSQREDRDCFFGIADLHTLTTHPDPEVIRKNAPEAVLDLLASGVDPRKSVVFAQSSVPETSELFWLLCCLMPLGLLQRATTFKDKSEKQPENVNAGLLAYPVLMAADILGPRAELVPVGEDQYQHLEMARELAGKFNRAFCPPDAPLFPEPMPVAKEPIRVPGLDGTGKMGKSEGNSLLLSDGPDEMWEKLRPAVTDPARKRRQDPGTPELCNIYGMHVLVSSKETQEWSAHGCRTAGIGCIECKKRLHGHLVDLLGPVQRRRQELAKDPDLPRDVLADGARRARAVIAETVARAKDLMGVGGA
jgi:tryptophanyl-tRNA synthetase